jgi:hypothetical protein
MQQNTGEGPDEIDWAPIRVDYEAGIISRYAICNKSSLSMASLVGRAQKCRWRREVPPSADRQLIIDQLMVLLQRQIDQLSESKMDSDKDRSMLNNLVRSLDKLIVLEKAAGGSAGETETAEMREIRKKLAKRIDALTKG